MSRFGRSAWRASATALPILFGGLVLMSLLVERGAKPSSPVIGGSVVGGRRMITGVSGGLAQRSPEEFKADNPFRSSKRRVPNGPDPIHNRGAGESGKSPGRV